MVFNVNELDHLYVHTAPVDLRSSYDFFLILIKEQLKRDITENSLFIFFNAARDRIKIIHHDGSGFWSFTKRLSIGRFQCLPLLNLPSPMILPKHEFYWFLAGLQLFSLEEILIKNTQVII